MHKTLKTNSVSTSEIFDHICNRRRSNRKFDLSEPVPDAVIERSLQRALLSPNSSNMQLWQFVWVQSPEMKQKMIPVCLGQQAAKTSSHMVAFVTRGDLWKERAAWNLSHISEARSPKDEQRNMLMKKYYGMLMPMVYRRDPLGVSSLIRAAITGVTGLFRPMMRMGKPGDRRVILHKSCALAAQTFMLSIAAEGYDTCPMEGFDRVRAARLLRLPKGAELCMIVAVGKGTEAGVYGERRRVSQEEVVRKI
jgi:nitroreductase